MTFLDLVEVWPLILLAGLKTACYRKNRVTLDT